MRGRMSLPPSLWFVILMAILGQVGLATANSVIQQCTGKELRKLYLAHCRLFKGKRSSPMLEALKPLDHISSTNRHGWMEDSHVRKRQIMSIGEIFVSSGVPMYDTPYPSDSSYGRHESFPIVPPTEFDAFRTSRRLQPLPKESSSDPNIRINQEGLIELFNEIFTRVSRSLSWPQEKQNEWAMSCCKGVGEPLCVNLSRDLPC